MVGFYPDPPGRRIPYDRDGSGVVQWSGTVLTSYTAANKVALNDETVSAPSSPTARLTVSQFLGVVFSAPMDIVGVFHASAHVGAGSHTIKWQHSLDTTTGQDGTWVDTGPFLTNLDSVVNPDYRTRILAPTTNPTLNVKGIRTICSAITGNATDLSAFHVYGKRSTPAGNWLMLWHPVLNQPLSSTTAVGDFGDVARGAGGQVLSFRVKNAAATLTAQSVTVLREALTDGSPTVVSLTTIRYNGGSYGTTAAIGNLGPGAISNVVDVNVDVNGTAPVGLWSPRVIAAAAAWV